MAQKVGNDRKQAGKAEREAVEYETVRQKRLQLERNALAFRPREYGVNNTILRGMKEPREDAKRLGTEMRLSRHCALQTQLWQCNRV